MGLKHVFNYLREMVTCSLHNCVCLLGYVFKRPFEANTSAEFKGILSKHSKNNMLEYRETTEDDFGETTEV